MRVDCSWDVLSVQLQVRTAEYYACILNAHSHSHSMSHECMEVQSELHLSVNAVFE